MPPPPSRKNAPHVRASDLRSVARLATQAALGTTRIVEGVHQSVRRTLGVPSGAQADRAGGLTGLVYRCVFGITQAVGSGIDKALLRLEPLLGAMDAAPTESPQRLAVISALNGVMGDRLFADANPLALPMTLHCDGQALNPDAPAPGAPTGAKLLLLVHGLCMNDLQWQTWRAGTDGVLAPGLDHGQFLARQLGYTPIYLRYNTGRHVSENARQLSDLLQRLLAAWPTPVQSLSVVAHSMGGLLTRSAIHQAQATGHDWARHLKHIVFLGTPHHGAPLERAGNWVDALLGSTIYSAPFARLAQLRSAGITDLRFGHLLDEDWQGQDRFRRQPDGRRPVPLPAGVACYTVAATIAGKRGLLADRLTGDGLVPLRSALGAHDDPRRSLAFGESAQWIAYRMHHMEMLGSPLVAQRLQAWLG